MNVAYPCPESLWSTNTPNPTLQKLRSMKSLLPILAFFFSCLIPHRPAVAGPFADDLSACLTDSTSQTDRTALIQWIFAAVSVHPDLNQLVQVTETERTQIEQQAANIFQRLLTEDCDVEAKAAFVNEGINGVQDSFGTLGIIAAEGLFENPAVISGLTNIANYVDLQTLGETLLGD